MRYVLKSSSSDNVLIHAGIKGMRWGVRRYQNEDGTLTEAGKRRYQKAHDDDVAKDSKKAYDTAVKKHLGKHPGDTAGAEAAGVAAANAAAYTPRAYGDDVIKDAVKKDLDATNTILREGGNAAGTAANAVRNVRVNVPRMDLSKMTDQEMRARIQREQLESQYDQMFNTKRHAVESGKATVVNVLEGVKAVGAIGTSALAIALAIKQLRS